jgi:hypothetical protein
MTADLVRARLIALGLASSATASGTDWVCLVGGLSDHITAPQVAIIDRSGLTALASHGNAGPLRPGIQVLVRGLPDSYAATATKTEAIFDALHRAAFGDLISIEAVGTPNFLGYREDTNAPTWGMNFLTIKR